MEIAATMERVRDNVLKWRYELSLPRKLALTLGTAALVGLLAQIRFAVPWSPVPITGQTFGVLLAGVLLGRWWGGLSMAVYGGLGLAGVPWFSGWSTGQVAGGGYILGFVLAALFLGYFTDRLHSRSFGRILGLMLFASFVLVYVPGVIWLKLWLGSVSDKIVSFSALLSMGVVPYLIGDTIKAVLAATVARSLMPKPAGK